MVQATRRRTDADRRSGAEGTRAATTSFPESFAILGHTVIGMTSRPARLAMLLALSLLGSLVPSVSAAGGTYYVDGKTGSDSDDGLSPGNAFKTIAKAATEIDKRSSAAGWIVEVKGYTDYIYRERPIPPGWAAAGTSSAPIVFRASGYAPGSTSYVKPIVSGSTTIAKSAWVPSGTAGVWKAPLASKPAGYGTYPGSLKTALFQDGTRWLWEQTSLSALATRASAGKGGYYWKSGTLYASGIGDKDPGNHTIDVPMRSAFLFMGTNGVKYVQVRGFDVRYAANGIAFIKGVDYSVAADNIVSGNLLMGIQTSGGGTSDSATGNQILRNRGGYNTLQAVKIDEGTVDATVCDNRFHDNGLQGIKVQGPPGGTSYTGSTSGILVCRNELYGNDYNPTGSAYNNASGLTIANGASSVTVHGNKLHGNDVGIHITQESSGRPAMRSIVLKRNLIWDNRRFGINFYDGAQSASGGSGSMRSEFDTIWANGIGIMVSRATSNKTVYHATIHGNADEGIKIGEAGKTGAKVAITESLITSNRGYGIWLVTGSSASVRYTGLASNALGSIKGSPSKTAVNTKPAGYASTTASNSQFLYILPSSYQFTAGPTGGPIGARYGGHALVDGGSSREIATRP
jgi:hypothetical protein